MQTDRHSEVTKNLKNKVFERSGEYLVLFLSY